MTAQQDHPAGDRADDSATPAGLTGKEWRDQVRRAQAAHNRGQRGGQYRRRAARGTLPGPGMIRRPPEPLDGDDAA